ncbi:MAG: metal ABC transporter ATP-binding protein [Arenicellales bacterium]|jgi:zinc transport system ATP-binding protein|nr:metal ABC transporter ATP-binding protein [Arenicellales bacterium]
MSLMSAEGIGVQYGARHVLQHMNFSIDAGEVVTIVGPNGAGKSVFLRVLIGAEQPSEGRVNRTHGLAIGYVPQRLSIGQTMPMNVARFLALSGSQNVSTNQTMLARVGIPDRAKEQMASLSGGEFQRVLLAHALLGAPQVLILDEPTQGLDQPAVAAFYRLIEEVRDEMGCAILMVSHDLNVVMRRSDRVICLNGHICCEGTPSDVSLAPEYQALFGVDNEGALALYHHEHDHTHDTVDSP